MKVLREEKSDNQCETTSDINALKDKVTTILPEQKDNDSNINDNKDKSDKIDSDIDVKISRARQRWPA